MSGQGALELDGLVVAGMDDGTDLPVEHSPRPYLHPLRSPAGQVVTAVAPDDHPWHHGLSLAVADVNGDNLWGGNTFVAGRGYVLLPDHGRIDVTGSSRPDAATAVTEVVWLGRDRAPLAREHRVVRAGRVEGAPAWQLHATSQLSPVAAPLLLGSPATRGRPDVGYGGWTLRMSAALTGAEVLTSLDPGRPVGEGAMGQVADWVCYRSDDVTVLLAVDRPCPWYVRCDEFSVAGPAPFSREVVTVPLGGALDLDVRVVVGDGRLDPLELLARAEPARTTSA
jgi:hypothetical protein